MKEEKKKNKIVFILYLVASTGFFISAIIRFVYENNMAVTQLCLGACFLCLALVYYTKCKDENKEKKE